MENNGALKGIKVVDLTRLLPGPYCSMILADHGARVIAIEDKRFMADGLYLDTVNRNKEHISLDLKTSEGKEIFYKLAKHADVVMEGFRPGVVEKLGVDYATISKLNPRAVYCSITGYGQTGPMRDVAGHDVNYLSYAGVLNLIGAADRPPSIPGVQLADIAGGGMYGAIGILMALLARERTGRGQYVDISMTDGMVSLLPVSLMFYQLFKQIPQRSETMLSHRYACYSTYETKDGRHLSIGAVENRFWRRLCELLDAPADYVMLQYDEARRLEIHDFLINKFKTKTLAEWEALLAREDVCMGPVLNLADVLNDPLFIEREMSVTVKGKDGKPIQAIGTPVKLSDTKGGVRTPPVKFGESTDSVLAGLGYSGAEIKALREKGVV
ncbi:MAG: CoA transferase [Deltaproteobacteria bacterium]|nr:CoA transferase [Deltaproteobacteria bacterium]